MPTTVEPCTDDNGGVTTIANDAAQRAARLLLDDCEGSGVGVSVEGRRRRGGVDDGSASAGIDGGSGSRASSTCVCRKKHLSDPFCYPCEMRDMVTHVQGGVGAVLGTQ